jgi:apolipoprotein N-acyltransferase
MDQATLYELLGDWPAWLGTLAALFMLVRRRRLAGA